MLIIDLLFILYSLERTNKVNCRRCCELRQQRCSTRVALRLCYMRSYMEDSEGTEGHGMVNLGVIETPIQLKWDCLRIKDTHLRNALYRCRPIKPSHLACRNGFVRHHQMLINVHLHQP